MKESSIKNIILWAITFVIVIFTLVGYLDGRADKEKSSFKKTNIE